MVKNTYNYNKLVKETTECKVKKHEDYMRNKIKRLNKSTPLSWLWALLFGPLYYFVHGFFGRAILILGLDFFIIGIIISPIIVYGAWGKRALKEAIAEEQDEAYKKLNS